jgi:ferredoxin
VGITPFRSIAREIAHGDLDAQLLLLYGSSSEDILFHDEFKELERASEGKVRIVHVLSCEVVSIEGCEQGFLTAELIRKYADVAASSFFICGPQVMYTFVEDELRKLSLPPRRIRRELYGEIRNILDWPGFPVAAAAKTFQMKVHMGGEIFEVPAKATESVLVAMERGNLAPPSQCRTGACGYCRSQLLKGEVFVSTEDDGRRAADREFGFFHPCASYPLSDLEIIVPRDG